MPNCKTIAICNQKGGTGKTTTTVNLGIRPREYDGSHITFNGMNPELYPRRSYG